MPREIKMPKLSDTMEEGTINVWRKTEGERIQKGDVLVEIETDKADMEFEAYMSGTLAKILVPAGETVSVGIPIAVVRLERDTDEDLAKFLAERGTAPPMVSAPAPPEAPAPVAAAPAAAARPAAVTPPPVTAAPSPTPPPVFTAPVLPERTSSLPFFLPDPDRVRATPRARAIAKERGIDLTEIAGSGPDGAILVQDLERYLEALEQHGKPEMEGDVHATPVALRIAEELDVDLTRVKGTGPSGRVTKRDIRDFLETESRRLPARERDLFGDEVKLSQKRKFLIRNMTESKASAPHFYIAMDVDAEPLHALRERLRADDRRITYTHLMLKAAAVALERFPDVNATFREDRILRFNPINIALAVDVQGELVAPVVKDCQGRDIDDLAAAADALIRKAREKKLAPEDYSDGTFTISNLGMFGVDDFYAIITPPQSCVLSVGGMRRVPILDRDVVRPGTRIKLGLAVDHRVLDGVRAAQFLDGLRNLLEQPDEFLASGAAHGS